MPEDRPSDSRFCPAAGPSSASATRRSRTVCDTRPIAASRCAWSTGLSTQASAPGLQRRDRRGTSRRRQHDHGGTSFSQVLQHLGARHAGKVEVEHHDVGPDPVPGREAGFAAQLACHLVAGALELGAASTQDVYVVVDEEHRVSHACHSGP